MKIRVPAALSVLLTLSASPVLAQQVPTIFVPRPSNVPTDLGKIISASFSVLLMIAGFLAFFYLIFGGIQWITSGGDKAGLESARNKIIHAIIGLIVVFSSWALMLLVQSFLSPVPGPIGGGSPLPPAF